MYGRITAVASQTSVTVETLANIRGPQGVQGIEGLNIWQTPTQISTTIGVRNFHDTVSD